MKGITKVAALTIIVLMITTCTITMAADTNDAATDNWSDDTYADTQWYDESETEFILKDAADLAGLAKLVNEDKTFKGKTVNLLANTVYDISAHEWTPIGTGTRDDSGITSASNTFNGTFNGNGATISGLTITSNSSDKDNAVGFFGIVSSGTVENLDFTNVNISVSNSEMAGTIIGMMVDGATVKNCTVGSDSDEDTSFITASRGNGGIVGRMTISGTIDSCTNYANVKAIGTEGNTGGIIGAAYYTGTGKTMTISGCHNHGTVESAGVGVGGIVGLSAANISNCSNNASVSGNGASIGGIVGEQQNYGSITECVNNGEVVNKSNNNMDYGIGGIVGWTRYSGADSAYPLKAPISITDCVNNGDVSTNGTGAGGIVGMAYHNITVESCESGMSGNIVIKGSNFVSGLVGGVQGTDNARPSEGSQIRIVHNECGGTIRLTGPAGNSAQLVSNLLPLIGPSENPGIPINGSLITVFDNITHVAGTDTITHGGGVTAAIIMIDDEPYGYPDVQTAVEKAPNDSTVTLVTDSNECIVIDSDKTLSIDLNGHTISNAETPAENEKENHTIINHGTLTIKDSAGEGMIDNVTHGRAAIYNLGTITMDSGKVTRSKEASTSSSDDGGNSWYVVFNAGTFNMNGGTITQDGHYSSLFINRAVNGSEPVMNMTGGTLEQNGFIALKNEETGTVKITGGDIISSEEQSMQNWGTATVSGGTLTGMIISLSYSTANGQDFKATTNIEGGTINGDIRSWKYTNKTVPANTAPEIKVSGGTINGSFEAIEGASSSTATEVDFAESGIKVSGGTFSELVPEDCVAEGTILVPNDDGSYGTVTTDKALIQESGEIVAPIVTDGSSYVLTSSGPHTDVTVTIQFQDGTIVINGDFQKGAYTVILDEEVDLADGMEAGFYINTRGIEIDSITVTVEVPVDDGYRLTSAMVYHQEDGSEIDAVGFAPVSFTGDGTVTFTTNTNSRYWIDATYEAVQTGPDFPPIWDDDDDYVPPVVPSQPENTSGDDDTTTIVACAAAAVVAALMAAFLIIERRRN